MFTTPIERIVYIYKHEEDWFKELNKQCKASVTFFNEILDETSLQQLTQGSKHSLLICDDQLSSIGSDPYFEELMCRLSHHLKLSILLLQQKGKVEGRHAHAVMRNIHTHIMLIRKKILYIPKMKKMISSIISSCLACEQKQNKCIILLFKFG